MIEAVFAFLRRELLHQWQALRVLDVRQHLPTERAVADGLEPRLERLEYLFLAEIGELLAETLQVAKCMLVDEAHEAEQFQQRVLERRRGEKQLVLACQRQLERVGDDVRRLVNIAQPVGFVDHHEVPGQGVDVARLALREMVGADNDLGRLERAELALSDRNVVRLRLQDAARQKKLFGQLLIPLLAQVGRRDDENPPPALRSFLREHEARFDGLAQADLIRQQRTFRKRRLESEQRGVDLVRVEVYLRIHQGACELLHAVGRTAPRQLVREIFGVIVG